MPPAAAAAAASVSLVLGSNDLLGEIFLRLGFPTFLVHAALACKRWLLAASDPAFLRRFRARHPPRLLGFYVTDCGPMSLPEFWPVRHPPELTLAVGRAASVLDAFPCRGMSIVDCRDSRLHISFSEDRYSINEEAVLSPLQYPAGATVILQPPPAPGPSGYSRCYSMHTMAVMYRSIQFLSDNGGDGLQCFELVQNCNRIDHQTVLKLNVFQGGKWRTRTSVTTKVPESLISNVLLMGSKLYMATKDNIFLLDLESASFSIIELPEKNYLFHQSQLLKADDLRVYLMTVRKDQLCFWLYRNANGSARNWLLVDTVHLDKIFADLGIPVGFFKVACVGENAEFVLLQMGDHFFYIDIRCRTIEEVVKRNSFNEAWPLMMIWPPSFPKVKEGIYHNE